MPNRSTYKNELSQVDRSTRLCLLYLENQMNEQFKTALKVNKPSAPKVDFSKLESKIDSLQKQINGLRIKTDTAYAFAKEYDSTEIFLKNLIKKADQVLNETQSFYKELYKSGFFKEGQRRKIREQGLIKE